MAASKETTVAIEEMRDVLQKISSSMEGLSKRIDEMADEIQRVKDSQNEMLAGLALYERGRRLKEDLGLGEKHASAKRSAWENVEAYCRNCMKMVPIIEPATTLVDERTTIKAKCKYCRTMVIRTII